MGGLLLGRNRSQVKLERGEEVTVHTLNLKHSGK